MVWEIREKMCIRDRNEAPAQTDIHDEQSLEIERIYVSKEFQGEGLGLSLIHICVLKKGGVFAIHDLMSPTRYGNMQMFVERLKEQGYEQVELIDTTKGMFMSPKEAKWLMLRGSALIVGKK